MPEWMLTHAKKPAENPDVIGHLKIEKGKPIRSVFSYMHTRHNVPTKEEAVKGNELANSNEPYRIYQWNEDIKKQKYDSYAVTKKIGQIS